ncbi:MAG: PqqD family protein [Acidimicrobiales bacterium]
MPQSVNSRPARAPGARLERQPGRYVLHDPDDNVVLALNESALALWELCDGETTTDEMVEAICRASSVSPEQATKDVQDTLHRFARDGLVLWESPLTRTDEQDR